MELPEDLPLINTVLNLREIIECKLDVPLERYFISLLSSCIKRDQNYHECRKEFIRNLKIVRKGVKDDDIVIYLKFFLYPMKIETIIHKVEKECKSKLRTYFEMRNKNLASKDEYQALVETEWKYLCEKMPEKYICAYHRFYFG